MFLGTFFHTIDDKGRVAIPHKYRSALGGSNEGRVIVTLSPKHNFSYVDIYPFDGWEETTRRILEQPSVEDGEDTSEVLDVLMSNFIHPAQEQLLDAQGRIVVPAEHREHAGLEKEAVFTGDIRKFRLWSLEEWRRFKENAERNKQRIRSLKGLSL